jgi:hypothetical protein
MTSIPDITVAFLLVALAFAALGSIGCVTARAARQALMRRIAIRRELSGDWCARFERELHAFAGSQGRAGRETERRE